MKRINIIINKSFFLFLLIILLPGTNSQAQEQKHPVKFYFRLHGYDKPQKHGLHADHPLLDGVHLSVHRWTVEHEENKYDWSSIEKAMQPFIKAGKKVVLKIVPYSKGMKTPEWIIKKGIPLIQFTTKNKTAIFPLLWDERNLNMYEDFIKALSAKFDGQSSIDFIEIGIGSLGFIYPEHSKEGVASFKKAGWSPAIWEKYIYKVMVLYLKHFHKTRMAVVFTGGVIRGETWLDYPDMGKRIVQYAVKNGFSLDLNSLDPDPEKWDNTGLPGLITAISQMDIPEGFSLGFGDDWPLWVSDSGGRRKTGKGSTGGRDDKALKNMVNFALKEWDKLNRQCPLYFTLLEPILTATNPNNSATYEHEVSSILSNLRLLSR